MEQAVFLSASVPDPRRSPQFADTADTVAITSAVSALVHVTLGRRILVWGGHPAITPMISLVAESIGVDYASWVRLYQSKHFSDQFPEDNVQFRNVTYTEEIENDRNKSLLEMRQRMLSESRFAAAVFIGGMDGVLEEFDIFRQLQPEAVVVPVASTGGAAIELASRLPNVDKDLVDDFDYVALFHRHLNISVLENRFSRPADQPIEPDHRLFQPPKADS